MLFLGLVIGGGAAVYAYRIRRERSRAFYVVAAIAVVGFGVAALLAGVLFFGTQAVPA